jgi:hypothetical protein
MTNPNPGPGYETPINRITPPTDGQQQQQLREEPYLHPDLQHLRMFGGQLGKQFGLDQMTPVQRKRWFWRVLIVFFAPLFLTTVIIYGGTALLVWAFVIGLVLATRWLLRRIPMERQRQGERIRRLNDRERRR